MAIFMPRRPSSSKREMERREGIEPIVVGLEDRSSTIELAPHLGGPTGIRTHVFLIESQAT